MASVLVGMSGGVDSSVSAALLLQQGYQVIGGFIKNWSEAKDIWSGECTWRSDRRDALRVCAALGIPLVTFDFEQAYRDRVVEELFQGYANGRTPNPDVLCNEAIKFGLFVDEARRLGMEFVAMGHYARVTTDAQGIAHLWRGIDEEKDQSYFLYRVPQDVMRQTKFPLGEMKKAEVRQVAHKLNLPVADKPDSQGICFIGKVDMLEFLRTRIVSSPGDIVDTQGQVLGTHQGLDGYTIGQRHRIHISQGTDAWYVAEKNMKTNKLVVVQGSDHPALFRQSAQIEDCRWIGGCGPETAIECEIQVRYRQVPVKALLQPSGQINFETPVKAVAPGQSAVVYQGPECLGGGVLE